MGAPKSNKCAKVREHIRANPGCTYQHIAAGIGLSSNKFVKDIRKMVHRGLVLCEERDGVRYHSIGREPVRVIGLPPEVYVRRKLDQQKDHRNRPEVRERRNARRRKGEPRDSVSARVYRMPGGLFKPQPEPIRAQTVEEFLAQGGKVERVLSSWERAA